MSHILLKTRFVELYFGCRYCESIFNRFDVTGQQFYQIRQMTQNYGHSPFKSFTVTDFDTQQILVSNFLLPITHRTGPNQQTPDKSLGS